MHLDQLLDPAQANAARHAPAFAERLLRKSDPHVLCLVGMLLKAPCEFGQLQAAVPWSLRKLRYWMADLSDKALITKTTEDGHAGHRLNYAASDGLRQAISAALAGLEEEKRVRMQVDLGEAPRPPLDARKQASREELAFFSAHWMPTVGILIELARAEGDLVWAILDRVLRRHGASRAEISKACQGCPGSSKENIGRVLRKLAKDVGIIRRQRNAYRPVLHRRLAAALAVKFMEGATAKKWYTFVEMLP